jgi:hypothetical protein
MPYIAAEQKSAAGLRERFLSLIFSKDRKRNMRFNEKNRGRVRTPTKETNGDLTQLHY